MYRSGLNLHGLQNLMAMHALREALEEAQEEARQENARSEFLQNLASASARSSANDANYTSVETRVVPIVKNMPKDDALEVIYNSDNLIKNGQYVTAKNNMLILSDHKRASVRSKANYNLGEIYMANNQDRRAIKHFTVAAMDSYYSSGLVHLLAKHNHHHEAFFWSYTNLRLWGKETDKKAKDVAKLNIPSGERGIIAAQVEYYANTEGGINHKIPANACVLKDGARWYKDVTGKDYPASPAIY